MDKVSRKLLDEIEAMRDFCTLSSFEEGMDEIKELAEGVLRENERLRKGLETIRMAVKGIPGEYALLVICDETLSNKDLDNG